MVEVMELDLTNQLRSQLDEVHNTALFQQIKEALPLLAQYSPAVLQVNHLPAYQQCPLSMEGHMSRTQQTQIGPSRRKEAG